MSDPKKDVAPKETGQVRMVKKLAKLAYYVTKQIKLTSWNHRVSSEADSDQQTLLSNRPGPDRCRVLGYGHERLKAHLPEYTVQRENRNIECKANKMRGEGLCKYRGGQK